MTIDEKELQKELDRVTALPKRDKPKIETFMDALLYQLDEVINRGDVGYTQEILIPIPEDVVKNSVPEAKQLIKIAGEVNRKKELDIPVDIKTEQIKGEDKNINMINLVFSIKGKEQAEELKEYAIQRGE